MATKPRVYDEYDSVDDHLLHEISKQVRYEELWALSRELRIPETERQKAVANKPPHEQIFQVCNFIDENMTLDSKNQFYLLNLCRCETNNSIGSFAHNLGAIFLVCMQMTVYYVITLPEVQ